MIKLKKCWIGIKQQSLTHFIFNATEESKGNIKINTIYLDKMVHVTHIIGNNTQYLLILDISWTMMDC